jgi:hypothetical protein
MYNAELYVAIMMSYRAGEKEYQYDKRCFVLRDYGK